MSFFHAGPAPQAVGPRPGALRDGLGLTAGMKVGLFGGSFNPAHDGHAHVAETALQRLDLDRVVWLVSPQNPLKDSRHTAPLADRMASARTFARGPAMIVSDFETRVGTSWTVDTLRALKRRHPGVHFVWLMGSDNLESFHRWRGWTDIMRMMPVAVIARPGSLLESRPPLRRPSRRGRRGAVAAPDGSARLDLSDGAPEPQFVDGAARPEDRRAQVARGRASSGSPLK